MFLNFVHPNNSNRSRLEKQQRSDVKLSERLLSLSIMVASLQNVADSTDAVGWSLILPSVKLIYVGLRLRKALVLLVGQQRKYCKELAGNS